MAISLTVQFYKSAIVPPMQSYDLRILATAATGMAKEVFVFQRPPSNDAADDVFVCVADPCDLEEFPVNVPNIANEMPYYRKAEVILRFRDMTTLEETLNLIKSDLDGLVLALKAAANVPLSEEVTYA